MSANTDSGDRPQPRLGNSAEAAHYLGVSRRSLRYLREVGEVRAVVIRGRIYYEFDELDRLIESHRESA